MSKLLPKAKAQLVLDQPFFASILLSMPIREDNSIPTMATNGDEMRYNAEWLGKLNLQELIFVLAHETMHCVFQHMYRRGNRDHKRFNIAADYVINDLLSRDRIGKMPEGGLLDADIVKRGNGTAEGVYNLLPEEPQGQNGKGYPGAGEPGGSMDTVEDAGKDEAERAEKEAQMKVKVIQAANAAKMAGKLSSGLERLVGEITKPKVDWRAVLRRFLTERVKTDLTYARPKRRWLAEDIYMPSMTGQGMGQIVVAVDCSGSISPRILNEFASEIRAIVEETRPPETHIIYFDSQVCGYEKFGPDDTVKLTPHGGGGTAFSPVFKYIEKNSITPVACVFLTDLYCDDFGPKPDYPVLWVSNGETKAPWGEVVKIQTSE